MLSLGEYAKLKDMSDDVLFGQAIEALRQGNKSQAREILTRLIRAEPENATYWVWLSAAVESEKERRYCLEKAYQIDPQNAAAQRGLLLLGVRTSTEEIRPFPLRRPRAWEKRLLETVAAESESKPTGRPMRRLLGWVALLLLLCGLSVSGFFLSRPADLPFFPTRTPGPSPTYTLTPTFVNATGLPVTPTLSGPPPLWTLLDATYTPTPLYVNTPRQPQSADVQRAAISAYNRQDWGALIVAMQQIAQLEPQAADPYYYIGEAYRFQGKYSEAYQAYQRAMEIDPHFAPAYLGQARVAPMLNPDTNVESLLNQALEYDPNLGEAYLERARYYFGQGKYKLALQDLEQAEEKLAGSPLVWLLRAQIYWKQGEKEKALAAAQEAYQRDLTLLPAYALLGEIYADQAEYAQAVSLLERYLTYKPNDVSALLLLGKVQYLAGKYAESEKVLSRLIELAPRRGEAYLYRGLARLEVEKLEAAIDDLARAVLYFPESYEAHLGLARAFFMQKKYGNAYQEAERAYGFAEDMAQKAQAVYWRALSLEKLGQIGVAIRDWNALLTTYADVIGEAQRKEAQAHLNALRTLTPTQTPKPSSTPTHTLSVTATP